MKQQEIKLSELKTLPSDEPICTGLVFKSHVSTYFDGKKMGERKSMNILKRKSCSCPECSFILEELGRYEFDATYSWLNGVEDDELYTIKPSYDNSGDGYGNAGESYMSDFTFVKIKG